MSSEMAFLLILIAILVILILPRFKINIAIAITVGALFLSFSLGANLHNLLMDFLNWHDFFRIIFIVFLSLLIVALMQKTGYINMMMRSVKDLVSSMGASLVSISAFIGLLPMPGGAYVSATLVDPLAREMHLTGEEATTLNYWFRHLWEYWWPLYTGVIVAAATFNLTIPDFMIHMCFLTVLAVIGGYIFIYYPIMKKKNLKLQKKEKHTKEALVLFIYSSWPILVVMVLTLLFQIDLFFSLLVVDIALIIILGLKKRGAAIGDSLKFALKPTFLGVTAAALFMKFAVLETNSMYYTYTFFETYGIPPFVVIMLLPYLAGLMTGVTLAYVAATFPLLLGYPMGYATIALAYASGYAGHLTSPVHLCLVLSAKHFQANLYHVIRRIIPSVIFVLSITLLIYFLF